MKYFHLISFYQKQTKQRKISMKILFLSIYPCNNVTRFCKLLIFNISQKYIMTLNVKALFVNSSLCLEIRSHPDNFTEFNKQKVRIFMLHIYWWLRLHIVDIIFVSVKTSCYWDINTTQRIRGPPPSGVVSSCKLTSHIFIQ